MTTPEILDQNQFFEALIVDINSATSGDRVAMSTMSYYPTEPVIARLTDSLVDASLRGADVSLAIDSYARMYHGKRLGPVTFNNLPPNEAVQQIDTSVSRLFENGVNCGFINAPKLPVSLLFAGRSHLKLNVVNDRVFLGGPNLHGTDRADLVADFRDAEAAELLAGLVKDIIASGNTREVLGDQDRVIRLGQNIEMIVDSGIKGTSTIYERANEMIDRVPERIIFGSQYLPDRGLIKKLLKVIGFGSQVIIIGNSAANHDQMRVAHALLDAHTKRAFPDGVLFCSADGPRFHAKGLVCDDEALIGTHNLNVAGVLLGTPEASLAIKDKKFAQDLGNKMLALAA